MMRGLVSHRCLWGIELPPIYPSTLKGSGFPSSAVLGHDWAHLPGWGHVQGPQCSLGKLGGAYAWLSTPTKKKNEHLNVSLCPAVVINSLAADGLLPPVLSHVVGLVPTSPRPPGPPYPWACVGLRELMRAPRHVHRATV